MARLDAQSGPKAPPIKPETGNDIGESLSSLKEKKRAEKEEMKNKCVLNYLKPL